MNISQEYIPDHSYTTYTYLYLGLGMAHEHDTISFIVLSSYCVANRWCSPLTTEEADVIREP